jgi:hypothetical protein
MAGLFAAIGPTAIALVVRRQGGLLGIDTGGELLQQLFDIRFTNHNLLLIETMELTGLSRGK